MIVGIDGDVLRYELGAVAMEKELIFDMEVVRPWPDADVEKLVDDRITGIIEATGSSEFEVYLTGAGNFRFDLATIAPYKGNRIGLEKPYHWATVSNRLESHWGARTVEGVEADDYLSLRATASAAIGSDYCIASRDKDLRMTPSYHFSWACGENQPEIPLYKVDFLGELSLKKYPSGGNKLLGNGIKFFYGQLLTGDVVDNIKGCPKAGPVKAYQVLHGLSTEEEMYQSVAALYHQAYGEEWMPALVENARLLWMIQDPSWVTVTPEGNRLICQVNNYWEPKYDYSRYDNGATPS